MGSIQTNNLESSINIDNPQATLRVGLTGGIGSGKSAVANYLCKLGATVIDTDAISHELTASSGLAIPAIREKFGDSVISADGSLDRQKMRALVFDHAPSRLALEQITHPLIHQVTIQKYNDALQHKPPYIVFVVPLLLESGQWLGQIPKKIDCVVVVDSPETQQISRVQERSNLDDVTIQKIMAAQAKREDRLAIADFVIQNTGSLNELETKTALLHESLIHYKNI